MGLDGIDAGEGLDAGDRLGEGALVDDGFCADEGVAFTITGCPIEHATPAITRTVNAIRNLCFCSIITS